MPEDVVTKEDVDRIEAKLDGLIVYFNQFYVQYGAHNQLPIPSPTPRIEEVKIGGTGEQFVPNSYGYRD